MIKMDIEDFIYEVKEEMMCYDEVGEVGSQKWESEFRAWLNSEKKKENVEGKGEKAKFIIYDESEIFDIADSYLSAIESNSVEKYWKEFQ